jgi:hypothetical protein
MPTGNFDPTKGGHMVIYEMGLIIEFPAGTNITLCSASMTHYNLPLGDPANESRSSFTQYFAGGLDRHIAYGYRLEVDLDMSDRRNFAALAEARWKDALSRFSTVETLREDRKWLAERHKAYQKAK